MSEVNRVVVQTPPTTPENPAANPPEPELIAGKFQSKEELIAAYNELAAKQLPPSDKPPEGDQNADPNKSGDGEPNPEDALGLSGKKPEGEGEGEGEGETVQDALTKVGLDPDKYTQSFITNGDLTPEDYTELEAKGFSRTVVSTYVNGLKAQQEQAKTETFAIVGSETEYRAMQAWANQSLTDSQRDAFNAALANPSPEQRALAIRGLHAQYVSARGKESSLVTGKAGASGVQGDGFQSWSEAKAAMADKRYGKDRDYTKSVEAKMAKASF